MKGSTGYNKKAAAHKAHNAHKQKLQGTVKKSASAPKASTGNKKIGGILGSYGKAMAGKLNKKAALTHSKGAPKMKQAVPSLPKGKAMAGMLDKKPVLTPPKGASKLKQAVTTPKFGKPAMPKPKVGKPAMGKSKKMGKPSMGKSKKMGKPKMGKPSLSIPAAIPKPSMGKASNMGMSKKLKMGKQKKMY